MWLSICGDPDCPNKHRVEELEREVARLQAEVTRAKKARLPHWDATKRAYVDEDGCPVADQFGQSLG